MGPDIAIQCIYLNYFLIELSVLLTIAAEWVCHTTFQLVNFRQLWPPKEVSKSEVKNKSVY